MKLFILFAFTLFLSACGTSGVTNLSLMNEPIAADTARLIITRDSSLLYMAAAADVEVNGREIANLGRGGSVIHDVREGTTNINIRTLGSSTKFSATFNVESDKTYEFEVSPRSKALWTASGYAGAFGLLGDSVNTSVNENSGYFQITLKEVR